MSEPQLERSVLEAKEREELYAIADALGTKPGSRARKADLITQILRATGVELTDETAGEKPRRTRAKKAVTETPARDGATTGTETKTAPEGASPPRPDSDGAVDQLSLADAGGRQVADARPEGPIAAEPPGVDAGANGAVRSDGQSDLGSNAPSPAAQEGRAGLLPGQPGTPHVDRSRFDGEPGNRRNRRRRGRDRSERTDRDLQGQSGEQQYSGEPIPVKGFLDLRDEGYGFLRTRGFLASPSDVYVSISQVRRFALRKGDEIEGACRPAGSNEKYPALLRIDTVSGLTPDAARTRPKFEDLTPLFPDDKLRLEVPGDPANVTARIVDLISPIGRGQRGLIVSPPKAGKTTVLKQIAHSIEANNPEVHLMVLLVDERPEEVTDMRRSVNGEVIASTFDRPAEEHTQVAELAIERARRLVERGKDVVIVLDGITRLARAYNLAQPASGRIMSGGIDTGALYPPKKFFGAARNIEEGGSLTILATALVETGSRMDEVIFEEFKGTGNMELRLDRKLSERRIYPALDVNASSTRHEELLFDRNQLQQVWKLRRVLNALGSEGSDAAGLQLLMDKIKTTKSNDEFLAEIAKTPAPVM
jgi:transcription termination factor Rho